MRHSTSRNLYRYWNEVRGDRIAPRRFEIEPSRISHLLPETFILEAVDERNVRYRLAGTRLTEQFGQEFRGANFFHHWIGLERGTVMSKLSEVVASGSVAVIATEASCSRGRKAIFEFVVMPLVHTQGSIDRLLGAGSCINPPDWLGQEPLVRQRLIDVRILTPERPLSAQLPEFSPPEEEPAPFLSHVRTARIVRQDRRQFRVYDGGLLTRGTET